MQRHLKRASKIKWKRRVCGMLSCLRKVDLSILCHCRTAWASVGPKTKFQWKFDENFARVVKSCENFVKFLAKVVKCLWQFWNFNGNASGVCGGCKTPERSVLEPKGLKAAFLAKSFWNSRDSIKVWVKTSATVWKLHGSIWESKGSKARFLSKFSEIPVEAWTYARKRI